MYVQIEDDSNDKTGLSTDSYIQQLRIDLDL